MRTVFPERRTLPSSTAPTFSLCATVVMSGCSPWKENDDVRAATCSSLMRARELRISSVSPSEKYSCSLSPLMFTNGSTAIECGGGAKVAADGIRRFEIQKYAGAARTATATIARRIGFDPQNGGTCSLSGGTALGTALAGGRVV